MPSSTSIHPEYPGHFGVWGWWDTVSEVAWAHVQLSLMTWLGRMCKGLKWL